MDLIQESYRRLFPEREFHYQTKEVYSVQLKDFNANIRLYDNEIQIKYNLQWKNVDEEIKIGLIQSLLLKLFKVKNKNSISYVNIDLYNHFLKQIPDFIGQTKCDPILKESFERVNDSFFEGSMKKPNLSWGTYSTRRLACYNYHGDLVSVSKVFKETDVDVLDFLMYHELLHKKLQFQFSKGRSSFHSPEFKRLEKLFPGKEVVDKKIDVIIKDYLAGPKKDKKVSSGKKKIKNTLLRFFR